MKRGLAITMLFLVFLLGIRLAFPLPAGYGAVPWFGWAGLATLVLVIGSVLVFYDAIRSSQLVLATAQAKAQAITNPAQAQKASSEMLIDPDGPPYPHPVITTNTCIGCHQCVDACPHDVLAIINGKAALVAIEQCMEDTSCQVECPTVPKSCVVFNSTKKIAVRKVPKRDPKFMTDVPGIYLIGDVSGVPLIKNAINEGGEVINYIVEDLQQEGSNSAADYDVAIIGIGPAGLSATAIARQHGLKYIALEQGQVLATIREVLADGKYVYFNPADRPVTGGLELAGAGAPKKEMIESWIQTIKTLSLEINENEGCKKIERKDNVFVVMTEQDESKEELEYKARRVILAIGNRGAAMKLNVPGEDLEITFTPTVPALPTFCNKCGAKRTRRNHSCPKCGTNYVRRIRSPYKDGKVKYKLEDPSRYQSNHCLVVGAGNSAIEVAVDLAAYRSEDGTKIVGWRDNTVTLAIRSGFKSDLRLGNKMLVYECIDAGKIKAHFGTTIKEIKPEEVILCDARDPANEKAPLKNDYVFALIGSDKPTTFLESLGIKYASP